MFKLRLLASAALLLAVPGMAHAVGQYYAFGDSLVDNGNLPKLLGFSYPAPPYYMNRFSNGPTFAEYLPGLIGARTTANYDFGVGGAFAGSGNLGSNLLPGVADELNAAQAQGIRLGRADTVALFAGANDYFALFNRLPQVPAGQVAGTVAAQVAATASNVGVDVQRIAGLGAGRIVVFNLPDLGATPMLNTDATRATASGITATHNAQLGAELLPLARQSGARIYLVNAQLAFAEVTANPARYGLVNTKDSCLATPSCVAAPQAQQNSFLFWDDVHPTTGVHDTLARIAANQLGAARNLDGQGQLQIISASDFNLGLAARLDARREAMGGLAGAGRGTQVAALGNALAGPVQDPSEPLAFFVQGGYAFGARDGRDDRAGFGYDLGSVTAGADYRVADGLLVGAAIGYGGPSAHFDTGGKVRYDAVHVGLYASLFQPAFFVDGAVSYSNFSGGRASRPSLLSDDITSKPGGNAVSVSAQGGYVLRFGRLGAGPIGGLRYTHGFIGDASEAGDPILTQRVSGYGLDSLQGHAGAQATYRADIAVGSGSLALKPYVSLAAEREFADGSHSINTSFDSAGLPLANKVSGHTATYGRAGVGMSAQLGPAYAAVVDFTTSFARKDGDDRSLVLRVKASF